MQIGIVGLGAIGRAVAGKLVAAGRRTMVWNRSPTPVAKLVERGAIAAGRLEEVFQNDVVLSVLYDDAAVRAVILDSGVLAAAKAGSIHVCMSTISTDMAGELAEAHQTLGSAYVAAPVFGRPDAAEAAKLIIALAGLPELLGRVEPILGLLGQTWRVGDDPRIGHLAKIAGNFLLGSAVEAMTESAALISSHGGDRAAFLTMLSETLLDAPIYRSYGAAIAAGASRDAAALRIALKDTRLAVAEARARRVPMPFAEIREDILRREIAAATERDR